jgi:deferrochelatase/peroxidase EfeB
MTAHEVPGTAHGAPAATGPRMSRRRLLGAAGAGAAVVAVGGAAAFGVRELVAEPAAAGAVPFHGVHQAGITTPAQDRLHFATFDVTTTDRAELVRLLKDWTEAAARMTAGRDAGPVGAVGGIPEAPPDDTGEAIGLPPARLTITVGFGTSLFDGRFGLASRRPPALADLPHFVADNLDPARSGGDLAVQACADDPQVAVHAIRNLARIAFGTAAVRYSQLGFGRTSSTSRSQTTPRNLFGFKDGTANVKSEDTALVDDQVWAAAGDGAAWMAGGSYLVTRRIRMHIEPWDRTPLAEQEAIVGRTKGEGAPLGRTHEFDEIDLAAKGADGLPAVPAHAHIRLAHPSRHQGAHLLRRGYNFVDGSDGLGRLDAGLFFMAYQRDPRTQFVPVQRALRDDPMNEYIEHVGSGLFACPPGVREGGYLGEALFSA